MSSAWNTLSQFVAVIRAGTRGWTRRPGKSLRLCESLALGEKRFVAVIEFGALRYLVGGTASSITLLSTLPSTARPPANSEQP